MTEKKTRSRKGWTRVRFGDVVRLATERCADPLAAGIERYVGLEHLEPSDLRIRSWGNVADGVTFTNRFHPGQVLFGKRRAYQRKVAVPDFAGVCSGDIYVFEPADDQLLPDLLPFVCQSEGFFEHALKTSAGSLSPRTNWKSLQAYEFDLPPVEEQRRITSLMKALANVTSSFSSALQHAQSLERAAACNAVESLARNHPIRPLGDGCSRITDGTHQSPPFTDNGVPFFLVRTISGGGVDWSHTKFVSSETYAELTRRVRPSKGHVLYTAVGATYGVAKLVDFDSPFAFQRHIAHIIPNTNILLGEYIELFLNSPLGKQLSDKHAIGSAQPTVTLRSLASFPLPFPPLAKQATMVSEVRRLRTVANEISDRMTAIQLKDFSALLEQTQ